MASIRFVYAQIGGGKSLYSTMKICEELERTDRYIVTNIPLVLQIVSSPERVQRLCDVLTMHVNRQKNVFKREKKLQMYWTISEYCHTFIKRPIDVSRRLVCLTEEQTREFWRYIPVGDSDSIPDGLATFRNESEIRASYGYVLPNVPDKLYGTVPDFSYRAGKPGIFYVLDEVHQHFPARFYQQTGPQVERYMSQLRKLNDDLDLVTQHPDKVDKNFRRNATNWVMVQNMSKQPLFMGVTFDRRFRAVEYDQPEMPTRFDKPSRTIWYSLGSSRRYEWLYKTAEGVGVNGGIVAEDSRFKGLHWSVWLIALVAIVVGAYFFPRVLMSATQRIVMTTASSFQKGFSKGMANAVPGNPAYHGPENKPAASPVIASFTLPSGSFPAAPAPAAHGDVGSDPGGVFCTGYMPVGTNIWVFLSDGSTCKSENGEVQGVGEKFVRVNGWRKIPVK